jgi:hypothetical protein
VAANATSIVPSSGLIVTSSQPRVTAAGGSGALPSTASQKGPSCITVNILTGPLVAMMLGFLAYGERTPDPPNPVDRQTGMLSWDKGADLAELDAAYTRGEDKRTSVERASDEPCLGRTSTLTRGAHRERLYPWRRPCLMTKPRYANC